MLSRPQQAHRAQERLVVRHNVPLPVSDLPGDIPEHHLAVPPLLHVSGSQPVLQVEAKREDGGGILRECDPDSETFHGVER